MVEKSNRILFLFLFCSALQYFLSNISGKITESAVDRKIKSDGDFHAFVA